MPEIPNHDRREKRLKTVPFRGGARRAAVV
jgi:hypothetical protein